MLYQIWNRRVEHWAIRYSFARTAHSFVCVSLHTARCARALHLFVRSLGLSLTCSRANAVSTHGKLRPNPTLQLRSKKKTNLCFSSKNEHTIVKSKTNEVMFGYSLKRRVFWVQAEHWSSIRLEIIQIELRHVKPKNCMQTDLHQISHF